VIRNEREYREAVERVEQEKSRLAQHAKHLRSQGLTAGQIKKTMEPLRSFHAQLVEEVATYERLQRGEFQELLNLDGLGQLLVSLRIASGLTQRQLAERLGVDEALVSRDERNEYHNIGITRATRILEAMGVRLRTTVEMPTSSVA
jgi:hypothetical protein